MFTRVYTAGSCPPPLAQWIPKEEGPHPVRGNRPFPSSPQPLFWSESKCEIFMIISSNFNENENWFSWKCFEMEAEVNSEMAYWA